MFVDELPAGPTGKVLRHALRCERTPRGGRGPEGS